MTTVLITGAGGAAVPSIVRNLRERRGYRVLVADMNPNTVGLYLADKGFVIPPGGSAEFLPAIRGICERERVDVVVPLVDEELLQATELESSSLHVIMPRRRFTRICLDKLYLMEVLADRGIPSPPTCGIHAVTDDDIKFPAIIKPRVGRGSRDVRVVRTLHEFIKVVAESTYSSSALIIQPYIVGTEYTVSVVVWRDGEVQAIVPKEIIYKHGITYSAVTRSNEQIDEVCRNIQSSMHADGPFNVQLILEKESGHPYVFEINPRYSTTTTLTTEAGVDEIGGLIARVVDPHVPRLSNTWDEGVVLLRHSTDQFMPENRFNSRIVEGQPCR
jgi:carbamoyl-phosphate synthase large subunit